MKKYDLLIVDDSIDWCKELSEEFMKYDYYNMQLKHNGKEALDYIIENKPDIIIFDLVIPEYDGFYVIDIIRRQMPEYHPFIYVVSILSIEKTNAIVKKIDVDFYSMKPIAPKVISHNLNILLIENDDVLFSDNTLDVVVTDYLQDLGAPMHLISTKCTGEVIKYYINKRQSHISIMDLYEEVSNNSNNNYSKSAIERNVRSTIKYLLQKRTPYFEMCYQDELDKLTNSNFIFQSAYHINKVKIAEYGFYEILDDDGSNTVEGHVDRYFYDLGAPMYLLSTKTTAAVVCYFINNPIPYLNLASVYEKVVKLHSFKVSSAAIERNVRSTVKQLQKRNTPYFISCFPQGVSQLSNVDFIRQSVDKVNNRRKNYK